jgi:hypothetical protein
VNQAGGVVECDRATCIAKGADSYQGPVHVGKDVNLSGRQGQEGQGYFCGVGGVHHLLICDLDS